MSANTRLLVLIGVPILLLAIVIILVPYRIEEQFINRRTGAYTNFTTTLLMHRKEGSTFSYEDLSKFGELTAADELLLVSKIVFPFFWSKKSVPNHWMAEQHLNSWFLKIIISRAFTEPLEFQKQQATLTQKEMETVLADRIRLWNELLVNDQLLDLSRELEKDNDRLFPGVRMKRETAQTITTNVVISNSP